MRHKFMDPIPRFDLGVVTNSWTLSSISPEYDHKIMEPISDLDLRPNK